MLFGHLGRAPELPVSIIRINKQIQVILKDNSSAISAICKTVHNHFDEMHFVNTRRLRAEFHSDTHLFSFENGQYLRGTLEQ
jgi:hypothetical protein